MNRFQLSVTLILTGDRLKSSSNTIVIPALPLRRLDNVIVQLKVEQEYCFKKNIYFK